MTNGPHAEGYQRGLQGLPWRTPAPAAPPPPDDPSALLLHAVRSGTVALRGRMKRERIPSFREFLSGFEEGFPGSSGKCFVGSLGRTWTRWEGHREPLARAVGRGAAVLLKREYDEGVAGGLSAYILDDRLHLRNARDYLFMRGWLEGVIEHRRRRGDWEGREQAAILKGNFSSIVLRALHNADIDYAAKAVAEIAPMTRRLDGAIAAIAGTEPEACHFLRKHRATILTRALHSGYLDYPEEAVADVPRALEGLNRRIDRLKSTEPEAAYVLNAKVPALLYRALTNGNLSAIAGDVDEPGDLE